MGGGVSASSSSVWMFCKSYFLEKGQSGRSSTTPSYDKSDLESPAVFNMGKGMIFQDWGNIGLPVRSSKAAYRPSPHKAEAIPKTKSTWEHALLLSLEDMSGAVDNPAYSRSGLIFAR